MNIINQKHFANILTFLNFISWLLAIIFIFANQYIMWIIVFLLWQFFDLFDWKLARKFWSTKNWAIYDDIADAMTFGILPWLSIIAINWLNKISILFFLIYTTSVFYRLWRFVRFDKKDKKIKSWNFCWLPSPAWALLVLSFVLLEKYIFMSYIIISLTSILMISRLQFAHFWNILNKSFKKKIIKTLSISFTTIICISFLLKSLDVFLYYIFFLWLTYIIIWRLYRNK